MAKNIKLTCNLTGDFRYVTEALYNKLCSQYGDEEKLLKFYVKKEISLLIKRGSRIMDIAVLHGFEYERDKEEYYDELVKFHTSDGLVRLELCIGIGKITWIKRSGKMKELRKVL